MKNGYCFPCHSRSYPCSCFLYSRWTTSSTIRPVCGAQDPAPGAVRYGYSFLDLRDPFFHTLVPVLAEQMADAFPELKSQLALVNVSFRKKRPPFSEPWRMV